MLTDGTTVEFLDRQGNYILITVLLVVGFCGAVTFCRELAGAENKAVKLHVDATSKLDYCVHLSLWHVTARRLICKAERNR